MTFIAWEAADRLEDTYEDGQEVPEWWKSKLSVTAKDADTIADSLDYVAQNPSDCPPATQSLELNTKNRNNAIQSDYIRYGPLNLNDLRYYDDAAAHWNTDVATAKKSKCSNCVAFDISPRMLECMPGPVSEPIEDEEGYLGYCWMHHFKCHSARTCYTWAAGGPISDNKVSMEWQDRAFGKKNPAGALPIFTGEPTSKFTNKGMISAEVQIGRNVVKDVGEVVQSIYRGLVGGRTTIAERRMAMAVASMQKELSDRAKAKGANAIANLNLDYELIQQSATPTLIATADAIKMRSPPKTKMTGAQYRSGVKKMLEAKSNPRKNGGHAISYAAVVLTEESREELLSSFQIPEGWSEFAHHMTITMGPLTHKKGKHDFSEEYPIGSTVELQVVGVGMDDKVMAVEVEPPADISAKISYPHITVAVNTEEGGKPFHSNKLDNSEFTPVEFTLYGEVTEVAQPDPNPTKATH